MRYPAADAGSTIGADTHALCASAIFSGTDKLYFKILKQTPWLSVYRLFSCIHNSFFNCIISVAFGFFCSLRYMLPLMHVVFCRAYKLFPRISLSFFYSFHSQYFEFRFVWGAAWKSTKSITNNSQSLLSFTWFSRHTYYTIIIVMLFYVCEELL
jgi:hypothetical protein